jgi:hypothetical protein
MTVPYTKSGKCGNTVWQRARYGQISYPAFVPLNPRSLAQMFVRGNFAAVAKRWRTLTQQQRDLWEAVARTKKTRCRLGQRWPMTGYNYFVKVNVALANRGLAQVDVPPGELRQPRLQLSIPVYLGSFAQAPTGPTLFLQASGLLAGWRQTPGPFPALAPPSRR